MGNVTAVQNERNRAGNYRSRTRMRISNVTQLDQGREMKSPDNIGDVKPP